jgi:hypothetical protein
MFNPPNIISVIDFEIMGPACGKYGTHGNETQGMG